MDYQRTIAELSRLLPRHSEAEEQFIDLGVSASQTKVEKLLLSKGYSQSEIDTEACEDFSDHLQRDLRKRSIREQPLVPVNAGFCVHGMHPDIYPIQIFETYAEARDYLNDVKGGLRARVAQSQQEGEFIEGFTEMLERSFCDAKISLLLPLEA